MNRWIVLYLWHLRWTAYNYIKWFFAYSNLEFSISLRRIFSYYQSNTHFHTKLSIYILFRVLLTRHQNPDPNLWLDLEIHHKEILFFLLLSQHISSSCQDSRDNFYSAERLMFSIHQMRKSPISLNMAGVNSKLTKTNFIIQLF